MIYYCVNESSDNISQKLKLCFICILLSLAIFSLPT